MSKEHKINGIICYNIDYKNCTKLLLHKQKTRNLNLFCENCDHILSPDCQAASCIFAYPGITGCSLEGDGPMAFDERETTATTAVVQQHE